MRRCTQCELEKEMSEFYRKSPARGGGPQEQCKECAKKQVLANTRTERGRLMRKRADRTYAESTSGRAVASKALSKWMDSNREQYRANTAVNNAVRVGKLVKTPCECCGASEVHGHHDDYNFPLSVRWLCVLCHKAWHKTNTPIRITETTKEIA